MVMKANIHDIAMLKVISVPKFSISIHRSDHKEIRTQKTTIRKMNTQNNVIHTSQKKRQL